MPSQRKVWMVVGSVWLVISAFTGAVPALAQEAASEPITEVQAVAWDTLPGSDWIAVGGFSASADYSQVQPFLTVRRAQDLSVVLDLTTNPNGHTGQILGLAWSPDGNYLVSGSSDGYLIVWNIRDPRINRVKSWQSFRIRITAMDVLPGVLMANGLSVPVGGD